MSMIFIFEAFSRHPGATFPAPDGCNVCACGNNGRPAMCTLMACLPPTLPWRHNECNGVSNRRRLDCLPNRLLRHSSKKPPKLRVTGLCEGNSPANSPHKGPVTRKMFPFDDVMRLKQQHKPYIGAGGFPLVNYDARNVIFLWQKNDWIYHDLICLFLHWNGIF